MRAVSASDMPSVNQNGIMSIGLNPDMLSVLFFLKGFLWFNTYEYAELVIKFIDLGIIFTHIYRSYRHNRLCFNRRLEIVIIFSALWIIHLSLTGFLEVIRPGYIPTQYCWNGTTGRYDEQMRHLVYESPLLSLKK